MSNPVPPSSRQHDLLCPVCSQRLEPGETVAKCSEGHAFDRAREGYFNLLLANQKGSNTPGDDNTAIQARRSFLTAGHYSFLVEALRDVRANPGITLDAGSGEGYFLTGTTIGPSYGVDISKPGIRLAARTYPDHTWIVANIARRIPISDQSCDTILSIMAPRNRDEFARILKQDGRLLVVMPGHGHLKQLVSQVMENDPPEIEKAATLTSEMAPAFCLEQSDTVENTFAADQETLRNLIAMTPLRWKSHKPSLAAASEIDRLEVTAAFQVLVYRLVM